MSRDENGNYTLPAGENPVAAGTVILASDFNTTLSDVATALTDSLSRSGKGGMGSNMKFSDGTPSAPAITWEDETTMGVYRFAAADMRVSVLSADVFRFQGAGVIQVYREAGWHSVIDAGTDQTFTGAFTFEGATRFEDNVTIDGGDLLIANNDKIRWRNKDDNVWENVLWVDDTDVFKIGNTDYTNEVRGVTTFNEAATFAAAATFEAATTFEIAATFDANVQVDGDLTIGDLTEEPGNALYVAGTYYSQNYGGDAWAQVIGPSIEHNVFLFGDAAMNIQVLASLYFGLKQTLRIYAEADPAITVENEGGGYSAFLDGAGTNIWTLGSTNQRLLLQASTDSLGVGSEVEATTGLFLPNSIPISANSTVGVPVNLIQINGSNQCEVGGNYETIFPDSANVYFEGPIISENNIASFRAKTSGGTARTLLYINGSDNILVGNANLTTRVPSATFERRNPDDTGYKEVGYREWTVDESRQNTNITLVLSDSYTIINTGVLGANKTITIPPNSSVAFPIGTEIKAFMESSANRLYMAAGVGVTLESAESDLYVSEGYEMACIVKIKADVWIMIDQP